MRILNESEIEQLLDDCPSITDPNVELVDISEEEGDAPLYMFKVKGVQYYFSFDEDGSFYVISDEEEEEEELKESDFGFMSPTFLNGK